MAIIDGRSPRQARVIGRFILEFSALALDFPTLTFDFAARTLKFAASPLEFPTLALECSALPLENDGRKHRNAACALRNATCAHRNAAQNLECQIYLPRPKDPCLPPTSRVCWMPVSPANESCPAFRCSKNAEVGTARPGTASMYAASRGWSDLIHSPSVAPLKRARPRLYCQMMSACQRAELVN